MLLFLHPGRSERRSIDRSAWSKTTTPRRRRRARGGGGGGEGEVEGDCQEWRHPPERADARIYCSRLELSVPWSISPLACSFFFIIIYFLPPLHSCSSYTRHSVSQSRQNTLHTFMIHRVPFCFDVRACPSRTSRTFAGRSINLFWESCVSIPGTARNRRSRRFYLAVREMVPNCRRRRKYSEFFSSLFNVGSVQIVSEKSLSQNKHCKLSFVYFIEIG